MKKVTLTAPQKYEVEQVPEPHAGPGEVRIKVAYNGVCGSDMHIWLQEHPTCSGRFPMPFGHEFSGIVDEIGEGVEGFTIGAPATIQPVGSCGKCKWCTDPEGNLALCPEETFYDGGVAEYYVAKAGNVITFQNNDNLKDIAFSEPLAVAMHGISLVPHGIEGKSVLVTGAGAIGLLTAQACKVLGASKVFVTDLMDNRLEVVKQLGLIPLNPLKQDFAEEFKKELGVDKVEVSFECAGAEKSLDNCVQFTETRGVIVLLAVFAKRPAVDMFRIEDREMRVFGSYQYTPDDFKKGAKLIDEKKLNLAPLCEVEFDMEDSQKAIKWTIDNPDKCLKTMIKIH